LSLPASALPGVALLLMAAAANAEEHHEFWPELQFHKWFNDHRSRAILMMSVNRDRDSGSSTQAEVGLTFEHHFTEWFWGRAGYRHGNATDGGPFSENRLLTEQISNMPLGFGFSAAFRTREDFRWLNTGFSVRLRERIQVQRDVTIGEYLFTPYASAEVYCDTQYNTMSRYRLIVGVTLPVSTSTSMSSRTSCGRSTMLATSPSPTPTASGRVYVDSVMILARIASPSLYRCLRPGKALRREFLRLRRASCLKTAQSAIPW